MDAAIVCEEIARRVGKVESVLDVGCGDGTLIRCLAERIAREAIGIDIIGNIFSERWISKDGSLHLARCMEGNAHAMRAFADNRFDAVVSAHTLHELSDPIAALREAERVLKPGGTILIADFAKGHEGERIWGETYYTPKQVEAMLRKCGFEEVNVQQVPGKHFLFASGRKRRKHHGPRRPLPTHSDRNPGIA